MDWGMQNRLAKIIHPEDGRCLMLAVDHGYFLGPMERLEEPRRAINPLLPYTDSLMLTRGILRTSVDPKCDIPIVLRVSGATSIIGEDLSKETITTSIEEAIRLNATCLALSIFVGSKYEHQTLSNLSKLVDQGKKLPEKDALNLTFNAIRDGASGVDMGRNIWQSDQPVEMIQAVRSIVHDGLSVEEAFKTFLIKKGIPSNELETLNTR